LRVTEIQQRLVTQRVIRPLISDGRSPNRQSTLANKRSAANEVLMLVQMP